jgi:RNA polymerase sigma-70 factor (ECF subfamily)
LSELYQRFGRLCYSLAHRICADGRLAEDVVHDVFVTLWRDPWQYDPARDSVITWLLTMTQHKAVDEVRRTSTARSEAIVAPGAAQGWPQEPGAGADQSATTRVAAGQVRAALDRLPGEQRQALVGAYFGGHTQREIAAFTGVPLATVKSRMSTAVRQLQSILTDQLGPDALVAEARAVRR